MNGQRDGLALDRIFTDKASRKDTKRPHLDALLTFVRAGDTMLVHSMDRLARNLDNLRDIIQALAQHGVLIELLSVMGAFAECVGRFSRAPILSANVVRETTM
jgi:DNA invertase Pin-like site-specific DNA recombinase